MPKSSEKRFNRLSISFRNDKNGARPIKDDISCEKRDSGLVFTSFLVDCSGFFFSDDTVVAITHFLLKNKLIQKTQLDFQYWYGNISYHTASQTELTALILMWIFSYLTYQVPLRNTA
ncbi:MAG TPA: hypothetical protein DCY03_27690 [Planctomycetaceae bacterium]|nr:hypothetical protein [Planctomycetaceae bacterium]